MRNAITALSAVLLSTIACAGLFAPGLVAAQSPSHTASDAGLHVFKSANCMGCHKWYGGGGGGYGGAALSLRRTQLTRDQIIEVVSCGRPGTGMPYHMRGAYDDDGKCYGGLTKVQLGDTIPPEPAHYLRPSDIAAVADYVVTHLKGKGDPTFEECQAFFGTHSRVCDTYPKAAQQADEAAPRSDLREFRIGMPVSALPKTGYTGFGCADDPRHALSGWAGYRD
jgi:mono/diheme cytochrome c family protein